MNRHLDTSSVLTTFVCDMVMLVVAHALNMRLTPLWLEQVWPADWVITGQEYIPLSLWVPIILVWEVVFLLSGVYDPDASSINRTRAFLTSFAISGLSSAGFLYLTMRELSRWMFLLWLSVTLISLVLSRIIARIIIGLFNGHGDRQRVLIAGADDLGQRLADTVRESSNKGIELMGFVSEDNTSCKDIVGTLKDAPNLIEKLAISQLLITLPSSQWAATQRLIESVSKTSVQVMVLPDYFHLSLWRPKAIEFGEFPLVDLNASPITGYQRMIKRLSDIVGASIVLALASPMLALIAIAIRIDSSGPALYRQKRVGENGRIFRMFKFRTMIVGAEQLDEELASRNPDGTLSFKHKNDPRVTRLGRFLRRSSLDELPQLINVIKGDMSLVGPRPELPHLVARYEPWQRQRFAVPQGLTGWWQVSARAEREMYLHTEDDLYYIRHYSVWLDIVILLRTPLAVLKGKGAY